MLYSSPVNVIYYVLYVLDILYTIKTCILYFAKCPILKYKGEVIIHK